MTDSYDETNVDKRHKKLSDIFKDDYRVKLIRDNTPEPAIYEQFAEECCELAQACLKKARKLRNENPTPKSMSDIDDNLIEELTDIVLCAQTLNIYADREIMDYKLNRWVDRTASLNS